MALPALAADDLQIFVFGPGTGELVAVRAPKDRWLLVDGCGAGRLRYGVELIRHYGATPSLIVLTHPHRDHASGVREVVDLATLGDPKGWPKIGLVWPSPRAKTTIADLQGYFEGGLVEDALAAITDRWERSPACRWNMIAGSRQSLGDASITVLSPPVGERQRAFNAWKAGRRWDPNRVATVLEVRWKRHRLLLGSDLVEKPGKGWSRIERDKRTRAGHAITKTPHHGSEGALQRVWLKPSGPRTPLFLVTPFARPDLPRLGPRGGVAEMLKHAPVVHLTGLPRAHAHQHGSPLRMKRSAAAKVAEGTQDPPAPGWPDSFVVVSLDASGIPRITHGPGSIEIVPG